eukprot:TRINITY_DN7287_c0_g1_i4.p1 TRINITY_DN7287_c0_g1~~TRINITY_DN7287_c0_g1_i4.p1  ORF type:complete len:294 (-),score=84.01 TRINITY_DN7287_c0_g1_i4:59-940(-)
MADHVEPNGSPSQPILAAPAEAVPAPASDVLSAHEVEEVFKLYDEDGDDALSPAELLHMIKVMKGSEIVNMGKLMKVWDKDGDGKVTKTEFIARVQHVCEVNPTWVPRARWILEHARAEGEETELERAARMLFDAFDTDGNGVLEAEEAEVLLGMCKEQMGQGSAGGGTETPGSKTVYERCGLGENCTESQWRREQLLRVHWEMDADNSGYIEASDLLLLGQARSRKLGHEGKEWSATIRLIARMDLSLIHISEPTRLLSISYAVFCLKKKKKKYKNKRSYRSLKQHINTIAS